MSSAAYSKLESDNKYYPNEKGENLEETVINLADGSSGKAYPSLENAMDIVPLPPDNTIFSIDSSNEIEAGIYSYDSTQPNGYRFVRQIVEIQSETSEVQLFNKSNILANTQISSANNPSTLVGGATTEYITIPEGITFLSYSGLGNSAARRIAWVTESDVFISTNTVNGSQGTLAIPATAKKFRFFYQRPADGDVSGTFMLNFGSQSLPYEPYTFVEKVNDTRFLRKMEYKEIELIYAVLNGTSPTPINEGGWFRCCPVVEDVSMKGNTGYGYDTRRNLHIVAEYNTTISSRILLFRDSDLVDRNTSTNQISQPFKTIDLTTYLDHIQGVTYDWIDDTYLAIGTIKGMSTGSNYTIVKMTPIGVILDIIAVPDLTVEVGMIDLDIEGNIIVKPNTGSNSYKFNRAYRLVSRTPTISNEGFCVNKYTGEIWSASNANVVNKYDKNYNLLESFTYQTFVNESGGSNVEGMAVLPNGAIVISADAFLHGGTQLGNSLFFFDFEGFVNKRKYFWLQNGVGNPKDNRSEYMSEIISIDNPLLGIEVKSNYNHTPTYRSGANQISASNAVFSSTLPTNPFIQIKIT